VDAARPRYRGWFEEPPRYGMPLFRSLSLGFLLEPWGLARVLLVEPGMIEVEIAEETTFDWGLSMVIVSLNHNNYDIGEPFLLG
jgi:hypothetical protein